MRKFLGTCFVIAVAIALFICVLFGYAKAASHQYAIQRQVCESVQKTAFGIMQARQNGVSRKVVTEAIFAKDMHPSSSKMLSYMVEQAYHQNLQFDAASRYNSMAMFARRMYKSCLAEKPDVFKLEEIKNNKKR